jgi:hypothetical protein
MGGRGTYLRVATKNFRVWVFTQCYRGFQDLLSWCELRTPSGVRCNHQGAVRLTSGLIVTAVELFRTRLRWGVRLCIAVMWWEACCDPRT